MEGGGGSQLTGRPPKPRRRILQEASRKPRMRRAGIAGASRAVWEQFQKSRYFAVQLSCAQRGKVLEKVPLKSGDTLHITLMYY